MVLTKDEILNLPLNIKEIETQRGKINIRPLTYKECCELDKIRAVGTVTIITREDVVEEQKEISLQEYQEASNLADMKAIAYSLSIEEEWTVEDLEGVPVALLTQLLEEIKKFNNIK